VLVSPDLVLTAAHCVRNNPVASAVVFYEGSRPVRPAIPVAEVARYDVAAADLPEEYAGLVELSLDTAVLRLAVPVHGRKPIPIGRGLPPSDLRLAGAGISQQGVGVLKTTRLDRLMVTSTGLMIAAARGSEVCKGDSGGPVVADGRQGPVLWGVASAVLSRDGACGRVVVIAPVRASF
jgi:secreted trypsin-like serine protease